LGPSAEALATLAAVPEFLGESYPCNAGWRYWALARGGRVDVVLKAFRERWATMPSVLLNNTLQEDWTAPPDSGAQWSHCAVAPLYVFFMSVAGLKPLAPGFVRVEIRPQPGDLEALELAAHTVRGPIRLRSQGPFGARQVTLTLPNDGAGELVVPEAESVRLDRLTEAAPGLARYRLPSGQPVAVALKHV
jgi:alpha-L-rhamnosidase